MSNFNRNGNLNPQALQGLLSVAAKKLGTTPDVLQKQLSDGTFEQALGNMPSAQANMLRQALSNPKTAEQILSTPQAQEIYKKLKK